MAKTLKNGAGSERCDRTHCNHTHMLHGNGSKAHGFSTTCVMAGCECGVYIPPPAVPRQPRAAVVRTLDRAEPKLFDVA